MGSFQSGQMEQTVNLLSEDFWGSNPWLPTNFETAKISQNSQFKTVSFSFPLIFNLKSGVK